MAKFLKDHLRKSEVNNRLLSIYKEILIYKLRRYVMKKFFNQISKYVILNYVVKNTSLRKKLIYSNCCIVKEEDLKKISTKFINRKDRELISSPYIFIEHLAQKYYKKVKTVNVTI